MLLNLDKINLLHKRGKDGTEKKQFSERNSIEGDYTFFMMTVTIQAHVPWPYLPSRLFTTKPSNFLSRKLNANC
jgi:hypothetical protein